MLRHDISPSHFRGCYLLLTTEKILFFAGPKTESASPMAVEYSVGFQGAKFNIKGSIISITD
jgi:hypothetical protein